MRLLSKLLDSNPQGKVVLLRSDLNTPLTENQEISDSGRVVASLPTIKALRDAGARVVILAHLGRPKDFDSSLSLAPVAKLLSKLLGTTVKLTKSPSKDDIHLEVQKLQDGEVLLVENIRFDSRETSKDEQSRKEFAKELLDATTIDGQKPFAFVSDGFGVVHRKQVSVYDLPQLLPNYAGYLLVDELSVLEKLTKGYKRPYAVILGGSKVSDKLGVISALAPKVDTLIIVGAMAFTILKAQGFKTGTSLVEDEQLDNAKEILAKYADVIHLPLDVVVAPEFNKDAVGTTVDIAEIPSDQMGLDIGEKSVSRFDSIISNAKTVFWNGPAGVFEFKNFVSGTKGIAESVIKATKSGAFSVIGGGDSAAAVRALDYQDSDFSHISTGGGASLEYLEGKELPGLSVLN